MIKFNEYVLENEKYNIFFSSDLHFGDERLNFNSREYVASSASEIDNIIISNWNKTISKNDLVFLLGDVATNKEKFELVKELNGRIILIKGNYDDYEDDFLKQYFKEVHNDYILEYLDHKFYLNHYPEKCVSDMFNICGHIHDKWKVQRNMINVGVDSWHFYPVSIDKILFVKNAIENHYDINVFAGELKSNK